MSIQFKNVTFEYDSSHKVTALKNLSLTINEGEFVVILGHNGSGKSTLARLMNGLLVPSTGDVEVFGINTREGKRLFDVRKNVGMVFQNPDNQMIATIIEDDIAFAPENIGLRREEIIERVDFALKAVDMEKFRMGTPFRLSGGQKQRIAIAGVLAMKPKFIVLDESTAMLDPKGRKEVLNVVSKLNKEEGIGVILITHFMEEALKADRVVVLSDGEKVLEGTPKEVFSAESIIAEAHLKLTRGQVVGNLLRDCGVKIKNVYGEDELLEELWQL